MNGDFAQYRCSATAAASKMNDAFPTNQPHTYQQNNVVQHGGVYHQFNPKQVPFQPADTGLERYQTPRTLNVLQHHNDLVDLVQDYNVQHVTATARLYHAQRGTARELDDLRNATESQLEALVKQMSNITSSAAAQPMQKQIESSQGHEAEAGYLYYYTGENCQPSAEMLATLSKETIANSYLDEAEKREADAADLRMQAAGLCPEMLAKHAPAGLLQIDAAPIVTDQAPVPGFACCQTEFAAIGELVEHVERAHTAPEHRLLSQKRSEAVEIKSPPNEEITSKKNNVQAVPVVEKKQEDKPAMKDAEQNTATWKPAAVCSMSPVRVTIPNNTETFSFEFIRTTFGGNYWSPGFYFVPRDSILPSKAYWILDATYEPFLPSEPGGHGAKLTAFFNETVSGAGEAPELENYNNVPVFIETKNMDEYSYFGNYSQLRFSDKIGYDTIASVVPKPVLHNHAEQLAETGRPAWVTKALQEHFWPKPQYDGPIPTDSALSSPATSVKEGGSPVAGMERRVMKALVEYAAELKDWQKDSKLRVSLLSADSIYKAFSAADTDEEPGLRPVWEYLQCIGWDAKFYEMLVRLKGSPKTKKEIGDAGGKRRASPDRKDGSTAAKMGFSSEATFIPSKGKAKEAVKEFPGPEAKTKFVKTDFVDKPVGSGVAKKVGGAGSGVGKKVESKVSGAPPAGAKGGVKPAKEVNAFVHKTSETWVAPHLRSKR